jgi:helix-turn-helix protein
MDVSRASLAGRGSSAVAYDIRVPAYYVGSNTQGEATPNPPLPAKRPSWKALASELIWSDDNNGLNSADRSLLWVLVRRSGNDGRCYLSLPVLARQAGLNVQTARKRLHALIRSGAWLTVQIGTFADLQAAFADQPHRRPRKKHTGRAPYLFTVRDGRDRPMIELEQPAPVGELGAGPGLHRTTPQGSPSAAAPAPEPAPTPAANCEPETPTDFRRGHSSENSQGSPLRKLVPESDPDPSLPPSEHKQMLESSAAGFTSGGRKEGEAWREAWLAVLAAHDAQHRAVPKYKGRPSPPHRRLTPTDPQEVGQFFVNYGVSYAAEVRQKAGVELDAVRAARELAAKTVEIFFRKDAEGGYLLRAHYPLCKLAEELGPRADEAIQELVKAYRSAAKPQAPAVAAAPHASPSEEDDRKKARKQATEDLEAISAQAQKLALECEAEQDRELEQLGHVEPADEAERAEAQDAIREFRERTTAAARPEPAPEPQRRTETPPMSLEQKKQAALMAIQQWEAEQATRGRPEQAPERPEAPLAASADAPPVQTPFRPLPYPGAARWGATYPRRIPIRHAVRSGAAEPEPEPEPDGGGGAPPG